MALTTDQLSTIDCYLRKSGIVYQEVYDELFDHFVSGIDAQMAKSILFENAFQEIVCQFNGKKGLVAVQRNRNKAEEQHYRLYLLSSLRLCIRWPNILLTGILAWLLYTLVSLTPTILALTYPMTLIASIPFLLSSTLAGRHFWQFKHRKRSLALSLEGFTLLSKSLGTASICFYPNLLVWNGLITPKNEPLNPTEQLIFFVLFGFTLFLCFVQIKLIIHYAKSVGTPPVHLEK